MPATRPPPSSEVTARPAAPETPLDQRRVALRAMPEGQVEHNLKLDSAYAALLVIGCAPKIAAERAVLVEIYGAAAGARIDDLVPIAHAVMLAEAELGVAAKADLPSMGAELRADHRLLFADAQALANRGLIEQASLDTTRRTKGYATLAQSTLMLVSLLRKDWATIASHTPLQEAELDRAEARVDRMCTALGVGRPTWQTEPAIDLRDRALTLLVREYEEVRRMLGYLRWHEGDADEIAPSLYARRRRRRRAAREEANEPDQPVSPFAT